MIRYCVDSDKPPVSVASNPMSVGREASRTSIIADNHSQSGSMVPEFPNRSRERATRPAWAILVLHAPDGTETTVVAAADAIAACVR